MMTTDPPQPRQRELLNEGQRGALAGLIRSFRRDRRTGTDWDMPGIHAAIVKAEQVADSGVQLAAAALAAAANPEVKTPGWIARPGRHWPDLGDGHRKHPTRVTTDVPCPDHEGHTMPCRACQAVSRRPTPEETAALKAAARTGIERRDEHLRGVERRREAARRRAGSEPAGRPRPGGDHVEAGEGGAPAGEVSTDPVGAGAPR